MILYKYLSPKRVDVLENLKIRFTQVAVLNDPFESLPGALLECEDWYLKRYKELIDTQARENGITDRPARRRFLKEKMEGYTPWMKELTDLAYLEDLSIRVQSMASRVQGILSLSGTPRNILMWSHYAMNHSGYVVGFDGDHEFFGRRVTKVEYSDIRPSIDPTKTRHSADLFHTKSTDWSYEEEYRLSEPLVEKEKIEAGGSFLPDPGEISDADFNRVHLFDFPKSSIREIIIGWRTEVEVVQRLLNSLERHQINEVKIYLSKPHESRYEMRLLPWNEPIKS